MQPTGGPTANRKSVLEEVASIFYGAIDVIAALLFCAMLSCMIVQVVFRYMLRTPLVWIEELAQFLLIWSIFWGAIAAHRRGLHPSVDFLLVRAPTKMRLAVVFVARALTLAVLAVVFVYGVQMVRSLGMVRSAAMNLPWAYVNVAVPLTALLMVPHQVRLLLRPSLQSAAEAGPSPVASDEKA